MPNGHADIAAADICSKATRDKKMESSAGQARSGYHKTRAVSPFGETALVVSRNRIFHFSRSKQS